MSEFYQGIICGVLYGLAVGVLIGIGIMGSVISGAGEKSR